MSQISIPGKSFLVGEYSVLNGGPGILLATGPYFKSSYELPGQKPALAKAKVEKITLGKVVKNLELKTNYNDLALAWSTHFHEDSPAGRFIKLLIVKIENTKPNPTSYSHHTATSDSLTSFVRADEEKILSFLGGKFVFIDPHQGNGGLGASTAQFLALIHFAIQNGILEIKNEWDLLQLYRGLASNGGQLPSGADLLAQNSGGLVVIHEKQKSIKNISWPFDKLALFFVRTGVKVPTHEHLKELNNVSFNVLESFATLIEKSIESANESEFLSSMVMFQNELVENGLQIMSSQKLCHEIMESGHFLFAKGCGAMGADILALISNETQSNMARTWLEKKGLEVVATLGDLAIGPRIFDREEYL